jgi:hypothetical protein
MSYGIANMYMDAYWISYGKWINISNNVGKWMIFYDETEIYAKWIKVCELIYQGHLFNAKVSTSLQKGNRETYVIIIYTNDYTNKKEIFNAGMCIKNNLFYDKEMYYKTNVQTSSGIYTDNSYTYTYSALLEEFGNIKIEKINITVVGLDSTNDIIFPYEAFISYEFDLNNIYDSNAIKILVDGKHVAYVKHEDCDIFKCFIINYTHVRIQFVSRYSAEAILKILPYNTL